MSAAKFFPKKLNGNTEQDFKFQFSVIFQSDFNKGLLHSAQNIQRLKMALFLQLRKLEKIFNAQKKKSAMQISFFYTHYFTVMLYTFISGDIPVSLSQRNIFAVYVSPDASSQSILILYVSVSVT